MNASTMPKWMLPTLVAVGAIVISFVVLSGSRHMQRLDPTIADTPFVAGVPDILASSETATRKSAPAELDDPGNSARETRLKSVAEIGTLARGSDAQASKGIRVLQEMAMEDAEATAMEALGDIYASSGLKAYSPLKAYTWYTLAVAFKAPGAGDKRLKMAEQLDEKELERGQAAAGKLLAKIKQETK